jgi:hypothetical protein
MHLRPIAALAAAFAVTVARRARADELKGWKGTLPSPREANVELGPDIGLTLRPASSGHGVTYDLGFAYGAHVQVPLLRVLRMSAYYSHAAQAIHVDPGVLGAGAPVVPLGDMDSYVIGLRVQPAFHFNDRLRVWANLGVAWGVMTAPDLRVLATPPFGVAKHGDAFVEFPFGFGGEFDFWSRWAGITADVAVGPVLGGFDIANPVQTIDGSGRLVGVPSLPPFGSVWTATLGLALHL